MNRHNLLTNGSLYKNLLKRFNYLQKVILQIVNVALINLTINLIYFVFCIRLNVQPIKI